MIKALAKTLDGAPMILLGLSAKNIELLKARKPILAELSELGMEGQVAIFYGETEEEIEAELKAAFAGATKADE